MKELNKKEKLNLIFEIIKKEGISAYEIAKNTSVTEAGLGKILNGESINPQERTIDEILKYLLNKFSKYNTKEKKENSKYFDGLPLIPIEAMAGIGSGELSINESDVEYLYIVPEFKNKADFLIRVSGNSMAPKYYNGDLVACKKIPTETFIQWGKVYIMDTVQGALCKRLSKSTLTDHVLVVSDNDKYPEFDLPKTEIRSLAIVIGVIRLE